MSILQNSRTRPHLKNILVILLGLIILLGSTFAWRDLSQHKTNPWGNLTDENLRDVTLNDQYVPVRYWQKNQTVDKIVSVTNLSTSGGDSCIRLSLKEFLQLRLPDGEEIRDKNDNIILFATFAEGDRQGEFMTTADAIKLGFNSFGSYFVYNGVDPTTGGDIFVEYATTNSAEKSNGIYGKPMKTPGKVVQIWGDSPRANISHSLQDEENGECNYFPYFWTEGGSAPAMLPPADPETTDNTIRDYIALNDRSGAEVISLESWAKSETEDGKGGKLGDYWIVDPEDGWVYWGNRLAPDTTTEDFLTDVKLIQHPAENPYNGIDGIENKEGIIDYYIHIDMEATDESEAELLSVFGELDLNEVPTFNDLQTKMNDDPEFKFSQEKFNLLALLHDPLRNQS